MLCVAAISDAPVFNDAIDEIIGQVQKGLKNKKPHLVVFFVSAHHSPCFTRVPDKIYRALGADVLVGVSGNHVIGNGIEPDEVPGMSLLAFHAPDARFESFVINKEDVPSLDAPPKAWTNLIGKKSSIIPDSLLLFAEPTTIDTQQVLSGLDFAYPGAHKVGALASGITGFSNNSTIFLNDKLYNSGLVGVAMKGISATTTINQSCYPIGNPMMITKTENNIIYKLGDQTPREALWEIYNNVDDYLKKLLKQDVMLGIAPNQSINESFQGNFLVRNITAVGAVNGSLAIGETVYSGQIVQFHVLDPKAAKNNLATTTAQLTQLTNKASVGTLVFSCLTRGRKMFGVEGYEANIIHKATNKLPSAGVFCNGQFTTIADNSCLMGYTTVATILSPTPSETGRKSSATQQGKATFNLSSKTKRGS